MKRLLLISIGMGLTFALLSIAIYTGYHWNTFEDRMRYGFIKWDQIVVERFDGLPEGSSFVEKSTQSCITFDEMTPEYLRISGGPCKIGYWLEVVSGDSMQEIRSLKHLAEIVAPVESQYEAVSLLLLIESDILTVSDTFIAVDTAIVSDGYLVELIHNNTFGCGDHKPISTIYKVSEGGGVRTVAWKKLDRVGRGFEACVD